MRTILSLLSIAVLLFAGATLVSAGNPRTGAILAKSKSCGVCHKNDLDGMDEAKFKSALKAYRSGERTSPQSMARRAGGLSDDEIGHLAAYFAGK